MLKIRNCFKIKFVPNKTLLYIFLLQIFYALIAYLSPFKTEGTLVGLVILLGTWLYVYNSSVYVKRKNMEDSNRLTQKQRFEVYLSSFWYAFQFVFFWFICLSSLGVIFQEEELFNSIYYLICLVFILKWYIEFMAFMANQKRSAFWKIFAISTIIGLFKSQWWTGIAITTSVIGSALSEDFVKYYVYNNKEKLNENDKKKLALYKVLVPIISLAAYVSLIINKDIISKEITILMITLNGFFQDPKELGTNSLAVALGNGFLVAVTFYLLIILLIKVLARFEITAGLSAELDLVFKNFVSYAKGSLSR